MFDQLGFCVACYSLCQRVFVNSFDTQANGFKSTCSSMTTGDQTQQPHSVLTIDFHTDVLSSKDEPSFYQIISVA